MRSRTLALLIGIGVAVIGGGIAFAYFTNVGSGSGGATAGSNNPVVVKQTSTVEGIAPGVTKPLSGNFDNPNQGPVYIASVSAEVSEVRGNGKGEPACTVSDFAVVGGKGGNPVAENTTNVGVEIPAGTAQGAWSGLTLQFVNKATNQDACKNAAVTISYTAK